MSPRRQASRGRSFTNSFRTVTSSSKACSRTFVEDFARRTPDILQTDDDADIASIARGFIDAACDTIEAKGSGGWQLLRSVGPDQEISAISKDFRGQLVQPWLIPLRELTGVDDAEAQALADMILDRRR